MITLPKPFKRGDTFSLVAKMTDKDGLPLSGIAAKLKAEVRLAKGDLLSACVVTETVTAGSYQFTVADTTKWEIGIAEMDIQYTDNGVISSSDTIQITVAKDITQ